MITSEYTTLYILRNQNNNKLILKHKYDKLKMVYTKRANAQKALNNILKWDPTANVVIEEMH
jgi:hypothetical protein